MKLAKLTKEKWGVIATLNTLSYFMVMLYIVSQVNFPLPFYSWLLLNIFYFSGFAGFFLLFWVFIWKGDNSKP